MEIVVSDTQILIDMDAAGILELAAMSAIRFHTVDLVMAELHRSSFTHPNIDKMVDNGDLEVFSFNGKDALNFFSFYSKFAGKTNLTITDCAVLKSLLGEHRKNLSWKELKFIQKGFGISVDAILVKAKQIGIISESTHRALCIEMSRNSELKRRVQESAYPKELSSRFERLVYKALADSMISVSKAASLLDNSIDEVNAQTTLA